MSYRMWITLKDAQYERLRAESRHSGLGFAELVRRAIDQVYRPTGADDFLRGLDQSFGAWREAVDAAEVGRELRPARQDRFPEW